MAQDQPQEIPGLPEARTRDSGTLPSVETPEHFWPSVLTLDEAAAFLRVSTNKLRALAASGEVPSARIGSAWRFSTQALLELLAGREAKPTHESTGREHSSQPRPDSAAAPGSGDGTAAHVPSAVPGAVEVPTTGPGR